MSNPDSIAERQRRYYAALFQRHGEDPRAVAFRDRATQEERFRRLLRGVDFAADEPLRIHEVGCGLGDLGELLAREHPRARYSGTDLVPEFVEHCRRRFPGGRFACRDFLDEAPDRRYDHVLLSGVLNPRRDTPVEEWRRFIRATLLAMYRSCGRSIAANFLTVHHDPERTDPALHYQDPAELIEYVVGDLSRHYELDAGGPLYEFTLHVHRPEHVRSRYPGEPFRRYFVR